MHYYEQKHFLSSVVDAFHYMIHLQFSPRKNSSSSEQQVEVLQLIQLIPMIYFLMWQFHLSLCRRCYKGRK